MFKRAFALTLVVVTFTSFNSQTMSTVEKLLIEQIDGDKSPSVQYLFFNADSIIYKFQRGLADIGREVNVNDSTTYNAFSTTKTFTALAILQLAEQGKLDIHQPIKTYLSEFPYGPEITVKQLLTHSAGIPNPIPLNWIHSEVDHSAFDRDTYFKKIFEKHDKTKSKPNEKFAYSNLGYFLLGQLIEKISNQTYEDYIAENIIKRLGLHSSELSFQITTQHATGYNKRFSFANFTIGFFVDKSKYMKEAEGKWKPYTNFYPNGASYAGLFGTPTALVKYIQELLKQDCKLISNPYKKLLFEENLTIDNKPTGMCLSWFKGSLNDNIYFAHAGGGGGYYCEIRIYPSLGVGSVIMFNRTGMSDERFLDKVDRYFMSK